MIGFDSIHMLPTTRTLRTFTNPHSGDAGPRVNILNRNQATTTWTKVSNTTTGAQAFGDTSERWSDSDSGITIKVKNGAISSVQANLSRLLTGNKHNGVIVRDQKQTDQALSRMWDVLDTISVGQRYCEFTVVEFGGVIEVPYTDLELLLKDRNIPGLRKPPLHRRRESLKFGAAKHANLSLLVYDKGRQLNKLRPWREMSKLDVDRYTRIELRLSGKKLRSLMSDDVRKNDAGDIVPAPIMSLVHDDWVSKFYDVLYSLGPDDTGKIPLVDNNFTTLLAEMVKHDHLRIGGVHVVDLFMAKVSKDRASKVKKAMSVIRCREQSLRDLVPMGPMPEPIDLVPTPIGTEEVVLKNN